jgi:hypothetical protein
MFRLVLGVIPVLALSLPAAAQVEPYPADFRTQEIQTNGTTLHVRVGGQGPAVVLLHGYAETGDMWGPQQQSCLMLHRTRHLLIRQQTAVIPCNPCKI